MDKEQGKQKNDISRKIVKHLRSTDFGASASQISKAIGHNRITISKYLEVLKAKGVIDSKGFAQAKVWTLNENKSKVLIVDDEKSIVNLIRLSLDSGKYEIYQEYSGKGALKLMRSVVPDVVILDLMMPEVSGFDVLEDMKSDPKLSKIPVIVLSAKSDLDDKIRATDLGAEDYLTKPFDPVELNERIKMVLYPRCAEHRLHPVTNLLNENSILSWVDKKLKDSDGRFTVISVSLRNFEELKKVKGVKGANDTLELISRLIKQTFGKLARKSVIGHTNKDSFVIVRDLSLEQDTSGNSMLKSDDDIVKQLRKEFNSLVPYIYHSDDLGRMSKKISLRVNTFDGESILNGDVSMFDILKS